MPVNNVGGLSTRAGDYSPPPERTEEKKEEEQKRVGGKTTLSLDDFYQLMAVQLQNQDMSNPMDNSEMMAQMVQMAMVEAMSTFTDLSVTTYATNLLGKKVEVFDVVDGENVTKTGTVTGVNLSGDVRIYLDGESKAYGIGNVMHVGELPPKEEEDDKNPDAPGTDDAAGSGDGPAGSGDSKASGTSAAGGAGTPADGANATPGTGNKPGPDDDTELDAPDINAITRMV